MLFFIYEARFHLNMQVTSQWFNSNFLYSCPKVLNTELISLTWDETIRRALFTLTEVVACGCIQLVLSLTYEFSRHLQFINTNLVFLTFSNLDLLIFIDHLRLRRSLFASSGFSVPHPFPQGMTQSARAFFNLLVQLRFLPSLKLYTFAPFSWASSSSVA